jgi:hypothetical protein
MAMFTFSEDAHSARRFDSKSARTTDGRSSELQRLSLADLAACRVFAGRLSREGIYRRFGTSITDIDRLARRLAVFGQQHAESYVITDAAGSIAALGSFVATRPGNAEVALIVRSEQNAHELSPRIDVEPAMSPRDLVGPGYAATAACISSLFLVAAIAATPAHAADASKLGWGTITEENNNLGADSDRYYVNGINLSWLSPSLEHQDGWQSRMAKSVTGALPLLFGNNGDLDRRIDWTILSQQIYTPANKTATIPDSQDRPYAGWLYTGFDVLEDHDALQLDDLSVTLGVVGPSALGHPVQNGVHKGLGFGSANGWSYQLKDEPAFTVGYAHKWRWVQAIPHAGGLQADVVPEFGITAGNVLDQAEATLITRLGWGLGSSYGPRLLSPGMEGDGYFAAERGPRSGAYLFAGVQGRGVAHNIFLDGNTWQEGPSVSRYPWVHEYLAGFSVYGWQRVRADFVYVHESEEFHGQQGDESYGSVTVSVAW